jgi:hypothetical protein
MAYDVKCEELAALFLREEDLDTVKNRQALSQAIQTTIEEWISFEAEAATDDDRMTILKSGGKL